MSTSSPHVYAGTGILTHVLSTLPTIAVPPFCRPGRKSAARAQHAGSGVDIRYRLVRIDRGGLLEREAEPSARGQRRFGIGERDAFTLDVVRGDQTEIDRPSAALEVDAGAAPQGAVYQCADLGTRGSRAKGH